jgi:hypothetical protein
MSIKTIPTDEKVTNSKNMYRFFQQVMLYESIGLAMKLKPYPGLVIH